MVTIGVDIGGTSVRVGAVREDNTLAAFSRAAQEEILTGDPRGDEPLEGLAAFIGGFLERNNLKTAAAGVTVGVPAPINREKTMVLNAPNIAGLDGRDVAGYLGAALGIPAFLEKDVSLLYYCDRMRFGLSRSGVTVAFYVGTGLGNAIAINGRVFTGEHGAAGELGHIPLAETGEICGCGNPACAEMVAGGKYLTRLAQEKFPDTPIAGLFARQAGHPLLEEYIERLSYPIASEINILDPGTVILGGGVITMAGFPYDRLIAAVRRHARKPLPERELNFILSDNNGENGVVGAGIYTRENL